MRTMRNISSFVFDMFCLLLVIGIALVVLMILLDWSIFLVDTLFPNFTLSNVLDKVFGDLIYDKSDYYDL